MKRKRRKWTEAEDEVLREFYGRVPTAIVAKKMNRSVSSITNRAWTIGLCRSMYDYEIIDEVANSGIAKG